MKQYFKDFFLLLVCFPYRWLVQALPFQISCSIATLFGNIQYKVLSSHQKHRFFSYLDLVFGNKLDTREKKTILRDFYVEKQKKIVDLFILGRKDYKNYLQICSIEGLDYVDQVLSQGKGMIGLNFHFGFAHLIPPFALYKGYKKIVGFLVLQSPIEGVNPWLSQQVLNIKHSIWKERGNFQIFSSLKSLTYMVVAQYQHLRQNYIVSAAGDGALGERFILVDFFNVKLKVPLGPALLSAKTGAALVPNFVIRRKDNAHHIIFEEPIQVANEEEETLKMAVQRYIQRLEHYVSRYPAHWGYWNRMEIEGFEGGIPLIRLVTRKPFET
ncbi:MAG TPA: lysophospholipid acyltransferase family protein [Candidatus Limnocylindrales bacterium]|nr:lysophospholipid acyltransferase family protein [Candidatus Limnocylindrales bacterium]